MASRFARSVYEFCVTLEDETLRDGRDATIEFVRRCVCELYPGCRQTWDSPAGPPELSEAGEEEQVKIHAWLGEGHREKIEALSPTDQEEVRDRIAAYCAGHDFVEGYYASAANDASFGEHD